ncbi:hypothetical protein N7456_010298 [Penicillium angulare]|uniref:Microbial-type PARG catalytic domain-containing protein n=1 Tax=Penicillium angulare TaxID=116970 RepID=A0A9W9F6G6_9EURO|nr:hypothetical protein N7456_010298 [Penicillium angulare]
MSDLSPQSRQSIFCKSKNYLWSWIKVFLWWPFSRGGYEIIPDSANEEHQQPSTIPPSNPSEDLGTDSQRLELRRVAIETLYVLKGTLRELKTAEDANQSEKISMKSYHRLRRSECPRLSSRTKVEVINSDTLNVAIDLFRKAQKNRSNRAAQELRPIIINFANYRKPGGGWLNGAMAQEEAICYRSSLALSLHDEYYPLGFHEAIYSPYVLVMREGLASGHVLMTRTTNPEDLPIVSVITIAAIHQPIVDENCPNVDGKKPYDKASKSTSSSHQNKQNVFARDKDRDITKSKMKLALRIAARNKHRMLVLGALGCGVYANPPNDIAHCWLEVLKEHEFSEEHWWSDVRFAVYDVKNEGNFEIFKRVLGGKSV